MTDRELLELAATAADIKLGWDARGAYEILEGLSGNELCWNPLADDGDALRLAIHFEMSVEISNYEESTYAYAGEVPRRHACESWRGDKQSATRRAIVRAAAAIAKSQAAT